jgi:hypothetical protein
LRTIKEKPPHSVQMKKWMHLRSRMGGALRRASAILEANRALLVESATDLLQHETLGSAELSRYGQRLAAIPRLVAHG